LEQSENGGLLLGSYSIFQSEIMMKADSEKTHHKERTKKLLLHIIDTAHHYWLLCPLMAVLLE
jgi:hypothetical protein